MERKIYGTVETTKVSGRCYSFQSTEDVENGSLVMRGALLDSEQEIYAAVTPAADALASSPVFLVANPAWTYDDNTVADKNEDNYINPKDHAFRVYELRAMDRFVVSDNMIDAIDTDTAPAKGQYVGLQAGSAKMKASAAAPTGSAFVGQIIDVASTGFAFAVGQAGNIGAPAKKIKIEVVKNG